MTHHPHAPAAALVALLALNGCSAFNSSGSGANTNAAGVHVAEAALDGGAGELALRASDSILRTSPNDVRALEIKGDALALLGRYPEATVVYQNLLAKDHGSVRANIGLGRIKLATDPAAAEPMFQQVLNRDPSNVIALNDLGIARDLLGRHTEAQAVYRQAMAINPETDSTQVNLALSLAMSGQGASAIELLRPRASQPDAPVRIKQNYAIVLAMTGYRAEAERVLGETMSTGDVRTVLDHVNVYHGRAAADLRPDQAEVRRVAAADLKARMPEQQAQAEAPAPRTWSAASLPPAAPAALPVATRPAVVADAGVQTTRPAAAQPISPAAPTPVFQRPVAQAAPVIATPLPPVRTTTEERVAQIPATQAPVSPTPERMPRLVSRTVDLTPVQPLPPVATPPATAIAQAQAPVSPPVINMMSVTTDHPDSPAPAESRPAPQHVQTLAAPAASTAPEKTQMAAPEPSAPPAPSARSEEGTAAVQFTAAPSEDAAVSFWKRLLVRFPSVLGQHEPTVIRAELDGRVFWRLRTSGFGTPQEAQALCSRMHAQGQDCFVPRS